MNLAEQIYQTLKPLPEARVQEVLDFALFLRQRESVTDWNNTEDNEWTNAEFTEMAMNQAMRGMEDEPSLYTLDALSEIVKNFLIQNYFNAKKPTEPLANDEQNTQQLLEMIKNIKPVTCEYSSEQIVRSLRDETPLA